MSDIKALLKKDKSAPIVSAAPPGQEVMECIRSHSIADLNGKKRIKLVAKNIGIPDRNNTLEDFFYVS